ncbi:hypothetical protein BV898_11583 [Hypsibius exemplaris]|uniref:Uncharacterized protein n=1 Tax=Hypsibius exemplaris TaxID=2072580 RepID=A0A1W0WGA6_HYPEX|nr:hypothetical protein BV898_11583 [Hypsibius exemplaris]
MSHSSSSRKSSSHRGSGGRVISDDKPLGKFSSSDRGSEKQAPAYRRWDQAAPHGSSVGARKPPPTSESSVEEQISRANAIADMGITDFMPQNFVSKRLADEEKSKLSVRKDPASKGLTGVLSGPVENLISPDILPKTEEERNARQAEIFTLLRKELLGRK